MSPTVTIGIPVFNGAATLRQAVESALAQTRPADIVYISDNASTDATSDIGRALAAAHERVIYTRHDRPFDISGNFGFLLKQARSDYFMWLAADDTIEPTYIERLAGELDGDAGLVACVSRAVFVRADGSRSLVEGTFSLLGDTVRNLEAYLYGPCDNSRIFGLYRTGPIRAAFPRVYFHAYDWAIAAGTLRHGRHLEVPEVLLIRDETPDLAYVKAVRRDHRSPILRLFPVLRMTLDLVGRQRIPLRWPVIRALLRLNILMHLRYASMFHPAYARRAEPLLRRYVLWRLEPSGPAVLPATISGRDVG